MNIQEIEFPNGKRVRLPAPILKVIPDAGQRYVILDTGPPNPITDNVLCYRDDGELRWRIEDVVPAAELGDGRIRSDGSMEFWNNDEVWIKVDKETGRGIGYRMDRLGPSPEKDSNEFKPIFWRDRLTQ